MNASRLQALVLLMAAGIAGFAQAGAGDITKRDQGSGSVELSNLGTDEDAAVVVAAPARPAVEPVARPMPAPASRPAPEVAAADRQAKPQVETKHKKGEEENADERTGDGSGDYAGTAAAARDGYANYGGGLGSYGYGAGAGGTTTGVIDTGATGNGGSGGSTSGTAGGSGSGSTGNTSVAGGSSSGSAGGSSSGYVNSNTTGAGSAPTAGLSPDQMALRVAQYREMMLNEQRGTNGLVANPAVQRRYLMINRAGYMGLGY